MGYQQVAALLAGLCLMSQTVLAQTTFDPMEICVGARTLGMGKAYAATADEANSIFNNPAGIAMANGFKFTSMSGKVLEEVNYSILGGVYPLGNKSSIGIGYALSNVPGIELRDATGVLQKTAVFNNTVLIASFGKQLTDALALGISLKNYSQDGTENHDGDGGCINFDVGLIQKGPADWFTFGIIGQNILSSNKLRYNNGETETLPTIIKAGIKLNLLGEDFESASLSPLELMAAADADLSLDGSKPTTMHAGLEFIPITLLALRCGVDQVSIPGGIQNDYTCGVSLKLAGLGFHYAYHPYGEFSNNATHYFGITFDERGWPPEEPGTYLGQI